MEVFIPSDFASIKSASTLRDFSVLEITNQEDGLVIIPMLYHELLVGG